MPNRIGIYCVVLVAVFAGIVSAKTVVDAKLSLQVELPDDWKLEEGDRTSVSTPEGFSLIVMRVEGKLPADLVKDLDKTLTGLLEKSQITDTDKVTANGIAGEKAIGYAMRDGNRVRFAVTISSKDAAGSLVVLAVGPETEFKRHLPDSDRAFESVKAK